MSLADRDGLIWMDGEMVPWREAKVHVLTHTFHYGLGVFEGVRAYNTARGTCIFRLQDHTNRLFNSAHILGMPMPFDKATLNQAQKDVVRENGLPLAGARITFLKGSDSGAGGELAEMMADFGGGGGGRSARAGDDGSYVLRDLPEGSHRLRITASGRTMPSIVAVELRSAENVFDIDLDVASVRGSVRDADGKPLNGAWVRISPVRPATEGAQDPLGMVEAVMPGGREMFGVGIGGK